MKPGINPQVDYAFKKVFGSESNIDLLASLVNAVLTPGVGPVKDLVIRNPFSEKDATDDKLAILDIKASDAEGRLYNIEMQMLAWAAFRARALYYWSKVYSQQLAEGNKFTALRPTISICFVSNEMFRGQAGYHHRVGLTDLASGKVFSDHLQMHFVELKKFALTAEQVKTPLDAWCYFLRHGESLDSGALPPSLQDQPIGRALEVLAVLTQSEIERHRYESRLMGMMDMATLLGELEDAKRERDTAWSAGSLAGQIRFCQQMLQQSVSTKEELEKLPLDELQRLADELAKQVSPPQP